MLNTTTGDSYTPLVQTTSNANQTIVTLTFQGTGIIGGSLTDGNYRLTIRASRVHGTGELETDVDYSFYRLFGDGNGDRIVDANDFLLFRLSYGRVAGMSGFNSAFDVDNDGDVDRLDYAYFQRNYLKRLDP